MPAHLNKLNQKQTTAIDVRQLAKLVECSIFAVRKRIPIILFRKTIESNMVTG
jgi:hypothetical protein